MAFLFISPHYPSVSVAISIQIRSRGLRVYGLVDGDFPQAGVVCDHVEYVNLRDEAQVLAVVDRLQATHGVRFAFVEGFSDFWLELESRIRYHLGLNYTESGPSFEAKLTKSGMKKFYQEAGVPTAAYIITQDPAEVRSFVKRVGFPVIVKPDRGSGASDTFRIANEAQLDVFVNSGKLKSTLFIVEEFIVGQLVSFDGLCDLNGDVLFSSNASYNMTCLDLSTTQADVACVVMGTNDPNVDRAGVACTKAFGIRGRFFHMEFFIRDGDNQVIGLEVNFRAQSLFFPIWDACRSIDAVAMFVDVLCGLPVHALRCSSAVKQHGCFFTRRSTNSYQLSHDALLADKHIFWYSSVTASTLLGDNLYYMCFPDMRSLENRVKRFLAPASDRNA